MEGREVFEETKDQGLRSPGEIHSQESKWVNSVQMPQRCCKG